ncbi:unnamed protein product [Schistocephalus solidus]|uniref:Uncharacterized protein n=1 Tax=Schistocephalus solidus TaxID=70667 RepID=A0A183S9Z1_SCHSO|nr:unnamed protein product [Schistocephalus solidus]
MRPFIRPVPWPNSPLRQPSGVTKLLPLYRTLQLMSLPWDSNRAAKSAHSQLNGSGALLSPLLLGVALHSRPLLGEALHSLLDVGTGGNNVVVRPTLHLLWVFM